MERGAEEDIADSGDFSENGSSGDSRDDNIAEGAMVLRGGDRVVASLEGDVADTWTSPSRGCQSLQRRTPTNVVRRSLMHGTPSIWIEKRRKLVHAIESSDAGGPSILAGPASPLPQPSTSVEASTMAIVMPIAVRGSPLRPTLSSMCLWPFTTGRQQGEEPWWCPPPFRPATTSALAVVQAASTNAPLVVDILSMSVATSIATPVTSPLDARVSVPGGGVVLEGIPPLHSLSSWGRGWIACH